MSRMQIYLTFIGVMNVLGTLVLLAALSDHVSDGLLRRWTAIIPKDVPFEHGPYTRLWLWWAIVGTSAFGPLNLMAAQWAEPYARSVVWVDVWVYGAFEMLAIAGSLSPRFGPGVHVCHLLWIGQAAWGLFIALG